MRKERATLKVSAIVANEGQLPWLPKNPRQWTQTDIDRTRNSILEDPDFLEDRPLLVMPLDEKRWLVFAGNLRREGAKSGKVKEVPVVIYYPETEEDHLTIKRRAMKDNGSFGAWDYDTLANEWGDLPLTDWGVPAWNEEKLPEENASTAATELGENGEDNKMNLSFSPEDYARVLEALLAFGGSSLEECLMLALGLNE